ncbi:LexA family transcriptional regulator [Cupriavidus necator]
MAQLNTTFNHKSNAAFINRMFTRENIRGMHESMVRLYEAAKTLKGLSTPTDVARALNQSQQTINNWERRGISQGGMVKAQAAIGCSATWLLTGVPPMEAVKPKSGADQAKAKLNEVTSARAYNPLSMAGDNFELGPDLRPRRYPEISWVQAGMWAELCENFEPDEHTIWHQCHIDLGPCGFVVTVRGPSMTAIAGVYPSFPDGIKLFVSPDAEALPGKYVIVRREGKATFKKLTLVEGEMYLEALNPDWPERYQRLKEGDQFCGVVRHAGFDL